MEWKGVTNVYVLMRIKNEKEVVFECNDGNEKEGEQRNERMKGRYIEER